MEYYFVYLTTNKINGKQYVGSHVTTNMDDDYIGSGRPYLSNAIKKYGKENFERTILKECVTIEEARLLEEPFIKKYKTLAPNGYNLSPTGGTNQFGGRHSEESKKKISESLKGKFKGRVFTEEWKQKLSDAKKDFIPWSKGATFSEEHRKNISKAREGKYTGENNNMFGKSLYDLWKEKYGEKEAIERIKKHKENLSKSVKGKKHELKNIVCPHCGKEGKGPNMTRYHFDKCKNKK